MQVVIVAVITITTMVNASINLENSHPVSETYGVFSLCMLTSEEESINIVVHYVTSAPEEVAGCGV